MTAPHPCPFCGERPEVRPLDPKAEGAAWAQVECRGTQCPTFDLQLGRGVKVLVYDEDAPREKAVARWNECAQQIAPFDRRAADRMADEINALIRRRQLDSRSPASDALLDYRDPPFSPRSDRLAALEEEVLDLRARLLGKEKRAGLIADLVKGIRVLRTMCEKAGLSGGQEAAAQLLERAAKKP